MLNLAYMSNETRVNLKHLLRDIRDSYTAPLEEVIISELIANSLDSKASEIHFEINKPEKYIRCVDNGLGMKRQSLKEYHNIASSTKTRGSGIGFAGLGAKLSLLLADKVVTESKGGYGSRCATTWSLSSPYRAPWKYLPFANTVKSSRGTSVTIYLNKEDSKLLDLENIKKIIIHNFYPLLISQFHQEILKYLYKKPINFYCNQEKINLQEDKYQEFQHWFKVRLGRQKQAIGVGFIIKAENSSNSWLPKILKQAPIKTSLPAGIWTSTYGKVIKGGWEWLGISPKNATDLMGLVEIPALSEILTTNKNDYLSDAKSLQKYYKYRKAIQEAIMPIFKNLGEDPDAPTISPDKLIKPINKTVTSALNQLVNDFPELESLIGSKKRNAIGAETKEQKENIEKIKIENNSSQANSENSKERIRKSGIELDDKDKAIRAKSSGLKINLADIKDNNQMPLATIFDNNLNINTAHPAWQKAKQKGLEEYHIITAVASVLAQYLDKERSPQEFINRMLLAWANSDKEARNTLF